MNKVHVSTFLKKSLQKFNFLKMYYQNIFKQVIFWKLSNIMTLPADL